LAFRKRNDQKREKKGKTRKKPPEGEIVDAGWDGALTGGDTTLKEKEGPFRKRLAGDGKRRQKGIEAATEPWQDEKLDVYWWLDSTSPFQREPRNGKEKVKPAPATRETTMPQRTSSREWVAGK